MATNRSWDWSRGGLPPLSKTSEAALSPPSLDLDPTPDHPLRPGRLPVYSLLGIKITPGSIPELNQEISRLLARGRPGIILSANVYSINFCLRLPWLADFYNRVDIVYVDGAGIVLGARLLGCRLPPRTTMDDWGWPAAKHLARHGYSLYLLGNPPGVAARAGVRLQERCPWPAGPGQPSRFF